MNINIFTSKWNKTGKNVSVPQYELSVRVNYTGADSLSKNIERVALFPDCLLDLPLEYVKDRITDMLVDYATIKAGARDG